MTDLDEIRKVLKKQQKNSRYLHTSGVAYTSACLAMRYEGDMNQAYLAGLLHDCAKHLSGEELLDYCKKNQIPVSDTEKKAPGLLHAAAGAHMAARQFEVRDQHVLDAIRWHTTGRPNMTLLEKIVFVADYIEPHRDTAPNLDALRTLAFTDINRAVCSICEQTLNYLKYKDKALDPMTEKTWHYYRRNEA